MSAKYTVSAVSQAQNQSQSLFRYIAPELILPNPKQPRRSLELEPLATLRESIRERGILQPLLVMRGEQGKYILVAGQRRLAAARELGLVRVPVMVLNEERPDYLVDSLLENIQREELSGIDEGHSFIALKEEFGWSQREIAARIHKHESYVSERIRTAERLTAATKEIISEAFAANENLARAKFSHSINRKLALLPDQKQEALARLVADTSNITARQVENLVRDQLRSPSTILQASTDIPMSGRTPAKGTKQPSTKNLVDSYQLTLAGVAPGEGFEVKTLKPITTPQINHNTKKTLDAYTIDLKIELPLDSTLVKTLELIQKKLQASEPLNLSELIKTVREDCELISVDL